LWSCAGIHGTPISAWLARRLWQPQPAVWPPLISSRLY
jgi:hypothetical protein